MDSDFPGNSVVKTLSLDAGGEGLSLFGELRQGNLFIYLSFPEMAVSLCLIMYSFNSVVFVVFL